MDLWKVLANEVPFEWIVVQENHRIQSDLQEVAYHPDIVGLVLPICHKDRNVVEFQSHAWVFQERPPRIFRVVLAADRQQDSSPFQRKKVLLKVIERLAVA